MVIELKEYDLPDGMTVNNKAAYKTAGLFLVDDGLNLSIVCIPKIGAIPFLLPMPMDILSGYIRHSVAKETELDVVAKLSGQIDESNKKLDIIKDILESDDLSNKTRESLDSESLLKAIAITQKPELAEKLLSQ